MCSQGLFAYYSPPYSRRGLGERLHSPLPWEGPGVGFWERLSGWMSKTGRATQTSKLIIKWILILIKC